MVAFIDANVVLECLALEQLPWREIHDVGPILVLLVPTVLQEVDSKKNNARLGDHARRFNRTVRPLLGEQSTLTIRESPAPRVELAFADCAKIDWEHFQNLDRDEADSRIVAQSLSASGPPPANRVLISQDIRPLHLAQLYGLRVHHVGENWLRPKEKSEAEKRADAFKREIDAMKNGQPLLSLSFSTDQAVVPVFRIRDLSQKERSAIVDTIVRLNPMQKQSRDIASIDCLGEYDFSLSDRYQRWVSQVIPKFAGAYERKLELNFGHVEITLRIENAGKVPAESLLIRLSAQGGFLNRRYVVASPAGPKPPAIRQSHIVPHLFNRRDFGSPIKPGKHEFVTLMEPERTSVVEIACEDFRHGYDYEYRLIAWIDPRTEMNFQLEATVTAANLYGEVRETLSIAKDVTERQVSDLVDMDTMRFLHPPRIIRQLSDATNPLSRNDLEFDGTEWDR
ncbi:PIN domain-containing protein [Propionivibrio dicarboxylicus]|uniref:PIN domain-containing protein n=1 Tax=Propionivibrio dicarboxylicus TaxID=83767 RepID=A0A1G8EK40_9RHOO|nr:PIN domain-containing protein [Propionivibrio dicarboxylicus]